MVKSNGLISDIIKIDKELNILILNRNKNTLYLIQDLIKNFKLSHNNLTPLQVTAMILNKIQDLRTKEI